MATTPKTPPSERAIKAAELEIAANHLRGQRLARKAKLGSFVQAAIDEALEEQRVTMGRG